MMEENMNYCQSCGARAETKYVEYHQNIGAIFMRFSKNIKGELCKDCTNKFFWEFTGTTFFLGWWGIISFFVTLFVLLNNISTYLGTLKLKSPSEAGDQDDYRSKEERQQVNRLIAKLSEQLDAGVSVQSIASTLKSAGAKEEAVSAAVYAASQGKIKVCPKCQSAFKASLSYCSSCGTQLSQELIK